MPLNSVNTNIGAMVALQSLNRTGDELATTQKRISTGYRVADAKDDGAAFAVAERIRSEISATTSANEQLGGAKGLLDVAQASLGVISKTLSKVQDITVKLAGDLTADEKTQYAAQVKQLTDSIKAVINDANYNGTNILKDPATLGNNVARNATGDSFTFNGYSALTNIFNKVSGANAWSRTDAVAALTKGGAITTALSNTLTTLNNFGSYSNYVDSQISYNKAKMDAQESGMGALVDADLAKESAKLQALQIRQQLGSQSLGIANQAPQTLLSLFRLVSRRPGRMPVAVKRRPPRRRSRPVPVSTARPRGTADHTAHRQHKEPRCPMTPDAPPANRSAAAYRRQLTPKQMEAEVFARCTRALRAAEPGDVLDRVRAVADNRRLWEAVRASVGDPANALPRDLRGGLAQLAQAVLRECDAEEPDLAFIAEVNEQTAAGLWR